MKTLGRLSNGENEKYVFNVGCPRIDLVAGELKNDSHEILKDLLESYTGVGTSFDLSQPFDYISTFSYYRIWKSRNQIEETLEALAELKIPTIMLWPNADAGGNDISKGIRTFREKNNPSWLYLFKNLRLKYMFIS